MGLNCHKPDVVQLICLGRYATYLVTASKNFSRKAENITIAEFVKIFFITDFNLKSLVCDSTK